MAKPTDYEHIKTWGKMLGSFSYYIEQQQEIAARDNAPEDALYRRDNGTWACASDLPADHGFHAAHLFRMRKL